MNGWSRRQILKSSLLGAGGFIAAPLLARELLSERSTEDISVSVSGPSIAAGHRLRDGFQFPAPKDFETTGVLILGGGISGLSAGWRLAKKGAKDFKILELENQVGGNSRSGENRVSKFPLGAHYLTLLNDEAHFARELFTDLGIIKDATKEPPVYDDYALCQAPHERLFIERKWQEGLLPKVAVSAADEAQAKAFFSHVEELRRTKGRDGRFLFGLPLAYSSTDPEFLALDQITMADYLTSKGWTSESLNWFVNYCCRDDFGTPHSKTSAWAGLHYFGSRRGRAEGVDGSAVLTWPEGNGWVVEQLRRQMEPMLKTNAMAFTLSETADHVSVDTWNEATQSVTRWTAKSVILAVPRFVAERLFNPKDLTREVSKFVSYSPWMVANITLRELLPQEPGTPMSWDNVFYKSSSLGYVVATHQRAAIHTDATVWTYYQPLDHVEPALARQEALKRSPEDWKASIILDLRRAHPQITKFIESIDVWVWGHAMVRPTPGFIWGNVRAKMQLGTRRVRFAHSDMSGMSLFEEANYHGVTAADEVLTHGLT